MGTFREYIQTNELEKCSVEFCYNRRGWYSTMCELHSRNNAVFGHPEARGFRTWQYKDQYKQVWGYLKRRPKWTNEHFIAIREIFKDKSHPLYRSIFKRYNDLRIRKAVTRMAALWLFDYTQAPGGHIKNITHLNILVANALLTSRRPTLKLKGIQARRSLANALNHMFSAHLLSIAREVMQDKAVIKKRKRNYKKKKNSKRIKGGKGNRK